MEKEQKEIPVLIDARRLCEHTLKITSNLNNFPKKYRYTLVDHIVRLTFAIHDGIYDANGARGEERIYYQTQVIANCHKLKFYIDLTHQVLHPECSVPYWNGLVKGIEEQMSKWRLSTKKES